ncbi:MAG: nucleotidyltransferase domain-containing protein [Sheuella sp.]|nr:nucleotidyltransferase domain-containing protein [Sheuella sp.]
MHTGLSHEVIQKIQNVLGSFAEIEKAVLYGSRAKGNYKPGSDIDLTLYGSGLSLEKLMDISIALDDLLLPYKIDLSIYTTLDNNELRDHIDRVGIIFFQRE